MISSLNDRQQKAVRSPDSPLIILAGPGTGKTHTLSHRIAYLLQEKSVPTSQILALTFTRAAAAEMKLRVKALLSDTLERETPLNDLWVDTFHAIALRILREQNYPFGPQVPFSVIKEEEKPRFLEGLMPRKDIHFFLESTRREKQQLLPPPSELGRAYQQRLTSAKFLDFDDLFIEVCRLFQEKPEALTPYRHRFQYVLVDEFQDTSYAQYQFMRQLASQNLWVIGDPDQAIYGFTSPHFHPFEEFKRDYPFHRVQPLSENYRSQAGILEAAKQVIHRNRALLPRELTARMARGFPIEINSHQTDRQEAEMIVRKIEGLLGGASYFTIDSQWAEKEAESYTYGLRDIVVLYRLHAQARNVEQALERAGLPYQTFGKKHKKNGEVVSAVEDLEDFQEKDKAASLSQIGENITLMTLHRSKGLEYPVVFLAGCEKGLLPYNRLEETLSNESMEEERRLFYVGMTRAKHRLFLSYAKKRMIFGKTREAGPSPFLLDIEEDLRKLKESKFTSPKKPLKPTQPTLF